MLHDFLNANRTELIERCRAKVALRPAPRASLIETEHGIPLFLGLLIETLRLEQLPSKGAAERQVASELATHAAKHGNELLRQGFSVDQVVHDYGDLCQAVTELAAEKNTPVSADEFRTLNMCLDNAIADSLTEFGWQRDQLISEMGSRAASEQLGSLAHALRNSLDTAILSFAAIKTGSVDVKGSTSAVLDRSFSTLRDLIDRASERARLATGEEVEAGTVAMDRFIAEVEVEASIQAEQAGCKLTVPAVEQGLAVRADGPTLHSAVSSLLQIAFKLARPHSDVSLSAYGAGDRVVIKVEDQCGGVSGSVSTIELPRRDDSPFVRERTYKLVSPA